MLDASCVITSRMLQDAAMAFCEKHGLPDAIVAPLAAHIQENLDSALAEARSQASSGDGGSAAAEGSLYAGDGADMQVISIPLVQP